jgi:hypothetical protein
MDVGNDLTVGNDLGIEGKTSFGGDFDALETHVVEGSVSPGGASITALPSGFTVYNTIVWSAMSYDNTVAAGVEELRPMIGAQYNQTQFAYYQINGSLSLQNGLLVILPGGASGAHNYKVVLVRYKI